MEDSGHVDGQTLMKLKTPEYLLHQVMGPVQTCWGSCQQILLAQEDVQEMALELLPNLQKEGKLRTDALRKLTCLPTARINRIESYLALACLFNLSQLDDGKRLLLTYAALPENVDDVYANYKPYDHPYCVLRIVEKLLLDYTSFLAASTSVTSVQGEAYRWSMAMLRHLATDTHNAYIVATQSTIPALAMNCLDLAVTSLPLHKWTRSSLPDSALMLLVHLAQHEECLPPLRKLDYSHTLRKIKGGGIHELRSRALWGVLAEPPQVVMGQQDSGDDYKTVATDDLSIHDNRTKAPPFRGRHMESAGLAARVSSKHLNRPHSPTDQRTREEKEDEKKEAHSGRGYSSDQNGFRDPFASGIYV